MRRDGWIVLILWVVLSVIGEIVALNVNIYPVGASEEATHLDGAFQQLMQLGIPVFFFVVVVMGYSVWRFRVRDGAAEDGPAIYGNRVFSIAWLLITALLAGTLFYDPGYTGWSFLHRDPQEDLVVQVEAAQWHWHVTYPEQNLSLKSDPVGWKAMDDNAVLALPAHERVKFEIISADVIHSFWIPAFRMKIDAVPNKTTTMYVTPNKAGSFEDDFNYRVQCAELCGTGHARMNMKISVMEPAEFEEWVTAQQGGGEEMDMGGGMDMGREGEQQEGGGDEHQEGDEHPHEGGGM